MVCKFYKQNVAGFLMEKEIDYLGRALVEPGAAVRGDPRRREGQRQGQRHHEPADKVDALIIGGAMAYTFYRAKGLPTGKSLVEEDKVDLAQRHPGKAQAAGVKLLLPVDHVIADKFDAAAATEVVGEKGIKDGWMALDIGPKSAKLFADEDRRRRRRWSGTARWAVSR